MVASCAYRYNAVIVNVSPFIIYTKYIISAIPSHCWRGLSWEDRVWVWSVVALFGFFSGVEENCGTWWQRAAREGEGLQESLRSHTESILQMLESTVRLHCWGKGWFWNSRTFTSLSPMDSPKILRYDSSAILVGSQQLRERSSKQSSSRVISHMPMSILAFHSLELLIAVGFYTFRFES